MNLPLPGLSFLKRMFAPRVLLYAGIAAFTAGVGVLAWLYWAGSGVPAVPAAEKALITASIDAQREELRAGRAALEREQERIRAEQDEFRRTLAEMRQLEGGMEKLMAERHGREVAAEEAQREAVRRAEEERLRAEEERLRRLAEEERRRLAAEAAADTLDLTNIDKLTEIYASMRPANMAGIIKELDEELALQVLIRLEERKVARLFAALDPVHAADLSGKLNELKRKGGKEER